MESKTLRFGKRGGSNFSNEEEIPGDTGPSKFERYWQRLNVNTEVFLVDPFPNSDIR